MIVSKATHKVEEGSELTRPIGEYLEPESAFGANLHRLREIKQKYDPTNVFHKWHGFWPKASKPV